MRSLAQRIGMAALLALAFVGPTLAEPAAWDQARVTSLAQQLAEACTGWQEAVLRQPEAGPRMQQNARSLEEQSEMLAAHLAKGKDGEHTKDYFRGLAELVDDTEELASRHPLDEATLGAWAKVADLYRQLAPYYGAKEKGAKDATR